MKLYKLDCEIYYTGRGCTYLERGERLLIIKSDNSVIIHQDKGTSAINYMREAKSIDWDEKWLIIEGKTEKLKILIHNIVWKKEISFSETATRKQKGSESDLQKWLSNIENFKKSFGYDCQFLIREFDTSNGSCDLLGLNGKKEIMIIEVKRIAQKNDAYQVIRYIDGINRLYKKVLDNKKKFIDLKNREKIPLEYFSKTRAYLIASEIKPAAAKEAKKHDIEIIELGYDWQEEGDFDV